MRRRQRNGANKGECEPERQRGYMRDSVVDNVVLRSSQRRRRKYHSALLTAPRHTAADEQALY